MDTLIGRTRRKAVVVLPVHVQRWSRVKWKLLFTLARLGVPDDGGLVDPRTENVIALLVPLQGKDGSLVLP